MNDAFRKLIRPEGATLEARNRAFHRMLVEGVTVEYRAADGAIRGAQARAIDFDDWQANDWLAVNQFTVVENKHERRLDVALFVNGLPLAVIELKNPNDFERTAAKATPRRCATLIVRIEASPVLPGAASRWSINTLRGYPIYRIGRRLYVHRLSSTSGLVATAINCPRNWGNSTLRPTPCLDSYPEPRCGNRNR